MWLVTENEIPGDTSDPFRFLGDRGNRNLFPDDLRTTILTKKLVNAVTPHADQYGRTLLHLACWANHREAAAFLLDQGADVNAPDEFLDSPFMIAGAEGRTEIFTMMLDNADKVTKFGSAGSRRRQTAVPDTKQYNRYGGSVLIPACERGHVEVVRLLLTRTNMDPDHLNVNHWSGLLEVVVIGGDDADHVEVTKLLIEHNADVNLGDGDGRSPLWHAKKRGFKRICALLTAAGAVE